MEAFLSDLRIALRSLRLQPRFAIAVIATFTLCIGASAAIFSLVYTALIRPFPFPDSERLVRIFSIDPQSGDERESSAPDLFDWRARARSFAALSSYFGWHTQISDEGLPEAAFIVWVVPDFFRVVGVSPTMGRGFLGTEDEPGGDVNKIVISHGLWRAKYGGDPNIVGRRITVRRTRYEIVGVMPLGFRFPDRANLWAPHQSFYDAEHSDRRLKYRGRRFLPVIGRLASGISVAQAQREMDALAAKLAEENPETNRGVRFWLRPLRSTEVGAVRPYLLSLWTAVTLVLLIGCANVANLLLARAAVREREMGVRAALGADRLRLIRQRMTESVVLAAIGGAFGVALAFAAIRSLPLLLPLEIPFWLRFQLEPAALAYSAGLALLAGCLCGVIPALGASGRDLSAIFKSGGRGGESHRGALRDGLVVAEIALAFALLLSANLMMSSFLNLRQADNGFDSERTLVAMVSPYRPGDSGEKRTEAYAAYYGRVLEKLQHLPGISAVGGSDLLPFVPGDGESPGADRSETAIVTRSDAGSDAEVRAPTLTLHVSPGFLATMGIPLLEGRDLTSADRLDASPVALVSRRAAAALWPGASSAIGREIRVGSDSWIRVVGVVGDLRISKDDTAKGLEIYLPYTQRETGFFHFVLRCRAEPMALAATVRRVIAEVDRETAVIRVTTLDRILGDALWQQRLWGALFACFAASSLALAAIGVWGVTAFRVAQRRKEIGIRASLGATAGENVRWLLGAGLRLISLGLAIGVVAAALLGRLLRGMLYGVTAYDPRVFLVSGLVLSGFAVLACYLPARRAARLDPVQCLRLE